MATNDIKLDIVTDVKQAQQAISSLIGSLHKLSSISGPNKFNNAMAQTQKSIEAIDEAIEKLNKRKDFLSIKQSGIEEQLKAAQQYKDLLLELSTKKRPQSTKAFKSLDEASQKKVLSDLDNIDKALDKQTNKVKKLQDAYDKVQESVDNYNNRINRANDEKNELISEQSVYSKLSTLQDLYNTTAKLGDTIKKAGSSISKFMLAPVRKLSKATIDWSKALRMTIQYLLGFRSLYFLVRKIRTLVTESFKTWAESSEEVKVQVDSLSLSMLKLKSSLLAVIQPILAPLANILTTIANAAVDAANAISQFFSILSGQGYFFKVSKNAEDYADALEAGRKSASGTSKALKDQLAAFDDINVLQRDTSGSGGGSVTDGIIGGMEKTDNPFNRLAELIKDGLEHTNFRLVGQYIAKAITKALRSINWGNVFKKAIKGATLAYTFVNGFFSEKDLAKALGETIGKAINLLITSIHTFITGVDWVAIGEWFAEEINSAIETVDWKLLGNTFSEIIHSWMTILISTIKEINWFSVGQAIGDMLSEIDWGQVILDLVDLGWQIVKGIASALAGWATKDPASFGIAAALVTVANVIKLGGFFTSLAGVLMKSDEGIKILTSAFTTLFGDSIGGVEIADSNAIGKAIGGAAGIIGKIGAFISAATIAVTLTLVIGNFIIDWADNNAVKKAKEQLLEDSNPFDAAKKEIQKTLDSDIEYVGKYGDKITGSWFGRQSEIIEAYNKAVKQYQDMINNYWIEQGKDIPSIWNLFSNNAEYQQFYNDNLYKLDEFFKKTYTEYLKNEGIIEEAITTSLDTISLKVGQVTNEDVYGTIKEVYDKLQLDTTTLTGNIDEDFFTMCTNLGLDAYALQETYGTTFGNIKDTVEENIEGMKESTDSTLDSTIESAKTKTNTFGNSIAKQTSETAKTMTSNVKSGAEGIDEQLTSAFNTTGTNAATGLNTLNDVVYNGVSTMGKTWANGLSAMVDKYNEYLMATDQGGGRSISTSFAFAKANGSVSFSKLSKGKYTLNLSGLKSFIPKLAKGGVIPPNAPFMAMLGDQKSGTNIEAPLDTIVDAMRQALSSQGGFGSQEVVLNVDGRELARVMVPREMKEMKRLGYDVKVLEG